MICKTLRHSYNILNRLKWIRNKKVTMFKNKRGLNKNKKEKNVFCKLENLFILLFF
jgi:hypothetical protein